jgi:hypothetical protein
VLEAAEDLKLATLQAALLQTAAGRAGYVTCKQLLCGATARRSKLQVLVSQHAELTYKVCYSLQICTSRPAATVELH